MTTPVAVTMTIAGIAAVAATFTVGVCRRRPFRQLPVVVGTLAIVCGFGLAVAAREHQVHTHPIRGLLGQKVTVDIVVGDDPRVLRGAGPPRVWVPVDVVAMTRSTDGVPAVRGVRTVDCLLMAPADTWGSVVPGQRIRALTSVRAPLRDDLTAATLTVTSAPRVIRGPPPHQRVALTVRQRFAEVSTRALPAPESGLLPGLILGDVSGQGQELQDAFRACGLSHLVAVSGANFAITVGAVLLLLRATGAPTWVVVSAALVVIVALVVLVRPSPSVVRAAVMGVVGVVALLVQRRAQALPALGTAIIVLLLVWPALAVEPGFGLSVLATAGLILVSPVVRDRLRNRGLPRTLADAVAVAATAQLVTIPMVVMISGQISLVGLLANLLVGPVVPVVTVIGTVAVVVGMLSPRIAVLVSDFTGPELWWLVQIARRLSALPGASVTVPDGVFGAVVATLVIVLAVALVTVARWRGTVGAVWQHVSGELHRHRTGSTTARRRGFPGRARDVFGGGRRARTGGRHRDPGDPGARR
ncbi:ComEC/Rec2 family competence protein [Williamsia sterculiae]|uniref:ComEC/Rec2 family competence protein n=1 Tax=Williamsia sterculiae TaxID=1344003 RepID=UPI00117FDA98|nr:ComEC/Rec2 family competence protein [Williamsia sterculiae]